MYGDTFTRGGGCDIYHGTHIYPHFHTNPYLPPPVPYVIARGAPGWYNMDMKRSSFLIFNILISLLLFSLGWRYAEKERLLRYRSGLDKPAKAYYIDSHGSTDSAYLSTDI